MNFTAHINKVIRTLGLMGIMMALAGFLAAANSAPASAASIRPTQGIGKVSVTARAISSASAVRIDVVIYDANANSVAKGTIGSGGTFGVALLAGEYKVTVSARGYNTYAQSVKVEAEGTSTINTTLSPVSPAPVPINN